MHRMLTTVAAALMLLAFTKTCPGPEPSMPPDADKPLPDVLANLVLDTQAINEIYGINGPWVEHDKNGYLYVVSYKFEPKMEAALIGYDDAIGPKGYVTLVEYYLDMVFIPAVQADVNDKLLSPVAGDYLIKQAVDVLAITSEPEHG